MKFDDYRIAPEIKRNLAAMGLRRPTDIQFKAIPPILNGEDVLAIAQTGTGKTAAFAIPILHMLNERKKSRRTGFIQCVVMEPTRELAQQITEVFDAIGSHTRVKTLGVFGGVEQDPQIARLARGVDILVATPGRMFDLVSQGHIRLDRAQILVLDEADHMLDLGFIKDIQDLVRFLPRNRQTLFFSATIHDRIKKLAYSLVKNPIRIQIAPDDPVARNITHSVAFVDMDDKRFFLARLIEENPERKILVFVRTRVRAERVHKALERAGIQSLTIHGAKDQSERTETMQRFREGELKILIATDVSARGIDIPDVDQVVNYDLPDAAENYVHRVGRTGRGEKKGLAVSFCSPEEKPVLDEIERFLGKPVTVLPIGKRDYEETLFVHRDRTDKLQALMEEIAQADRGGKKPKKK
ncbi:MAG: DEAD/DEAH box helicase [Syntrophales bacterium]|nr:DEAD/DEAH box helicase [Syntrophales bacterium]